MTDLHSPAPNAPYLHLRVAKGTSGTRLTVTLNGAGSYTPEHEDGRPILNKTLATPGLTGEWPWARIAEQVRDIQRDHGPFPVRVSSTLTARHREAVDAQNWDVR